MVETSDGLGVHGRFQYQWSTYRGPFQQRRSETIHFQSIMIWGWKDLHEIGGDIRQSWGSWYISKPMVNLRGHFNRGVQRQYISRALWFEDEKKIFQLNLILYSWTTKCLNYWNISSSLDFLYCLYFSMKLNHGDDCSHTQNTTIRPHRTTNDKLVVLNPK